MKSNNTAAQKWWIALSEEGRYQRCCKHFAGIPTDTVMDKSIEYMYQSEHPQPLKEDTPGTVTGGEGFEDKIRKQFNNVGYMDGDGALNLYMAGAKYANENLKQQLSTLQSENDRLKGLVATDIGVEFKMEAEIAALKADNERLREALKGIGNLLEFAINATPTGAVRNLLTDANILAKAALTPVQDTGAFAE